MSPTFFLYRLYISSIQLKSSVQKIHTQKKKKEARLTCTTRIKRKFHQHFLFNIQRRFFKMKEKKVFKNVARKMFLSRQEVFLFFFLFSYIVQSSLPFKIGSWGGPSSMFQRLKYLNSQGKRC
jgi:hypothetical protein